MRIIFGLIFAFLLSLTLGAQVQHKKADTLPSAFNQLPDITVIGTKSNLLFPADVQGTLILAGKKSSTVLIDKTPANLSTNNMRQVLAKVPGIQIWESDPGGTQISIATRGLSPNRSWDFNIRQNGYDIAADPYGYPEAYYTPPLQGVEKIEVVRGQAALQYGPQFGGMVNYVLKNGSNATSKIQFESEQTIGSNGLWNVYQSVSGKTKKIFYCSFFNHRRGKGWRTNSQFSSNTFFNTVTINLNTKWSLTAELTYFNSLVQQPGGLTDQQFAMDSRQSLRSRNWLDLKWTTPAISIKYMLNSNLLWNTKVFALIGERNSVGFMQSVLVSDSINAQTQTFNPRILSADYYRNLGVESQLAVSYLLFGKKQTLSSGIRWFTGNTSRKSNGIGSTQQGFDMSSESPFPQQLDFTATNHAWFVENMFSIGKQLSVIPGARVEQISGSAMGISGLTAAGTPIDVPFLQRKRNILLKAIAFQYNLKSTLQLYTNVADAYRPIQFSNLQAPPTTDSIDAALTDAKGYNADLGIRGRLKNYLRFDVSIYQLSYRNRIGSLSSIPGGKRLVTNVGDSKAYGMESYLEFHPSYLINILPKTDWSLFCSYSYLNARYSSTHQTENIRDKVVENAPPNIVRTGISMDRSAFNITLQFSFTDATFSDANNTIEPTANALNGAIPSYRVWDLNISKKIKKLLMVNAGINNIFNEHYFTRRASGYPGPGVMPADGRTFFMSLKCNW
jgi:Fe(3+) dicitrate transport protein